jgi:type IV pilus assembly protein PilA
MRKQKGFSLIELLIVVAIILIIAAIAIPNLMRSKMAANEAASVASVRTLNTAQATYSSAYQDVGYADTIAKLGPPASGNPTSDNAGLIDSVLATGKKSNYNFSVGATADATSGVFSEYVIQSWPLSTSTGLKVVCSTQDGVLRAKMSTDGAALTGCTATDAPPLP